MTANPKTNGKKEESLFNEAPASWNTRYVDPNGFECQITLRCETGVEVLEKAAAATGYLLENGCTPYVYSRSGYRPTENKAQEPGDNGNSKDNNDPSWCPIHECIMKRWNKNGRSWYSHKTEDGWCRGKE